MRFVNVLGREMSADDWILWCVLWSCAGLLAGGAAVLFGLAWVSP